MTPKYKYGDKVRVRGNEGKIVSARKALSGNYIYTVRFSDTSLIPPEMDYLEYQIEENTNNETHCPVCKTKWNVVKFNMNIWKDCITCNETSEKIIEKVKNNASKNLLEEFENTIGDNSDYAAGGFSW